MVVDQDCEDDGSHGAVGEQHRCLHLGPFWTGVTLITKRWGSVCRLNTAIWLQYLCFLRWQVRQRGHGPKDLVKTWLSKYYEAM